MWYSVVFAILVELLPTKHRSMGLAISLFVVNNVGGNLPIIVTPLTSLFGFRGALTILYPGALLVSKLSNTHTKYLIIIMILLFILNYLQTLFFRLHAILYDVHPFTATQIACLLGRPGSVKVMQFIIMQHTTKKSSDLI